MNEQIFPSILDASPDKLLNLFKIFQQNNLKGLHIDIMDGNYVPSYGFNDRFVKWIHTNTNFYQDIHLMVVNSENAVPNFIKAHADSITIHLNTTADLYYLIDYLNKNGINSGVALNPGESPYLLESVLPMLHHVLVMTICPGRPAQKIVENAVNKIKWLDNFRKNHNLNYRIEVDGGINANNIAELFNAGCNDFVSGGFIINSNHPDTDIKTLQQLIK